ncbi:MAG: hemolysin family protein [Bullifex sp.]|nr:hemolysin family protein [Spirochaetales bacterium]MDD7535623.1 hemolysin family protein [Spirochaetales bacterium]MDY2816554.1 hemolysin family protein [Bullifex sp.]MDY5778053.1 hemolysin family protein [Bullifex sp.]
MVSVPKQLLIQAILIALNAFFAAMEIAVISLNTTKLKRLVEEGDEKAGKLLSMAENPAGFLSTIQVGISLSGFLGAAFAADSLSEPLTLWLLEMGVKLPEALLNNIAVIIITLILTFMTIVFGELIPKRIAQQKSYEVAKACCGIISVISVIFKPIILLISGTTNLILRMMKLKTEAEDEQVSEDDIRMMVDVGGESGSIEEDEKEMIQNIFEFNDIAISEIMTRVSDVNAISIEDSEEDILRIIKESGNSRFPVYKDDINDIIGILNSREFLINLNDENGKSVRDMLRKPYFVPETIKADQLFSDMQKNKVHISIVIDEYGETRGIVTLEDLLEEIVGNIYDEYDAAEAPAIEPLPDGRWKVQGTLSIEDLNDELGIHITDDRDYDTVGGMIFSCLHTIPEDGKQFTVEVNGLKITVTRVEDKRIIEAIVEKTEKESEDEEEKSE